MPNATSDHPDRIPVIDVAALVAGKDCIETAQALRAASQNPGFIYVRQHGISAAVIENARRSAAEFFRQAPASKATIAVSPHHRGWLESGAARMADDVPPDLKESFIWGSNRQARGRDHTLRGPNQWPTIPGFREHAIQWFDAASELARRLLQAFAIALDLDREFFLRQAEAPLSRASFVHYPAAPAKSPTRFGVGPHTDFGVLTILCQDDVGGLQIADVDGTWVDAPPIEGTLIVNVGDLLERWTNGAFRSAPHRVIAPTDNHRLSLVLAFDPKPETMIDAREVRPGTHDYPAPITCGDYLDWRFSKAFEYRNRGTNPGIPQ